MAQESAIAIQPSLDALGLKPAGFQSMSERYKVNNPPGYKWPYHYFTLDIEYLAVTGTTREASGAAKAHALRAVWAAAELPSESRLRFLYRDQPPSFAAQHPRYEGICMGHIASGPHGWSCPCGERTRTRRKW